MGVKEERRRVESARMPSVASSRSTTLFLRLPGIVSTATMADLARFAATARTSLEKRRTGSKLAGSGSDAAADGTLAKGEVNTIDSPWNLAGAREGEGGGALRLAEDGRRALPRIVVGAESNAAGAIVGEDWLKKLRRFGLKR